MSLASKGCTTMGRPVFVTVIGNSSKFAFAYAGNCFELFASISAFLELFAPRDHCPMFASTPNCPELLASGGDYVKSIVD